MGIPIRQTVRAERVTPGGRELTLELRTGENPVIPCILQLPEAETPVAGVLILHGFSSRKEVLSETVGRALLRRGIAALSVDLPLHGTRHDPIAAQALRNPIRALGHWRQALREAHAGIGYLRARQEIDRDRIGVVGYSLGSQLAVAVAAADPGIRATVVAAGGDLPDAGAISAIARTVSDPIRAVRSLGGRPLLLIHGTRDRTVTPAQARRLFEAAGEPKEIRWFEAGHHLPVDAVQGAVEWLAARLE